MSTPKNRPHAARAPTPPHPLGNSRAARVEGWRAIVMFGDPKDTLVRLAKLALYAADAPDDKEAARRALIALGLHGPKKADTNLSRLRDALEDLGHVVDAMYPPPDPETGEPLYLQAEPGSDADKAYRAAMAEGFPMWLYRRVKGAAHGDEDTAGQFLKRTARGDPEVAQHLDWFLAHWRARKPAATHSRGRVR